MIIDFHTHVYPDNIAAKAIAKLTRIDEVSAHTDGTLTGLKASMSRSGVDYSVVLPVATAPHQVSDINKVAGALNGKDGIIYAGAIHPLCNDYDAVLDEIKSLGLSVIKIHPDFQGFMFHDDKYLEIMAGAARRGLYTVTHAGYDFSYPNDIHCPVSSVLYVLDALKGVIDDKLILAHMGSFDAADEVLEKLVGLPVYMDTAAVLSRYPDKCLDIIRAHGADKILFATDSPWYDQGSFVNLLNSLDLDAESKDKILWGNASKILEL